MRWYVFAYYEFKKKNMKKEDVAAILHKIVHSIIVITVTAKLSYMFVLLRIEATYAKLIA